MDCLWWWEFEDHCSSSHYPDLYCHGQGHEPHLNLLGSFFFFVIWLLLVTWWVDWQAVILLSTEEETFCVALLKFVSLPISHSIRVSSVVSLASYLSAYAPASSSASSPPPEELEVPIFMTWQSLLLFQAYNFNDPLGFSLYSCLTIHSSGAVDFLREKVIILHYIIVLISSLVVVSPKKWSR